MYEQHEEDSGDEDDDKEVKADVKLGPTIKYSEVNIYVLVLLLLCTSLLLVFQSICPSTLYLILLVP